jgi:hypothetical protein
LRKLSVVLLRSYSRFNTNPNYHQLKPKKYFKVTLATKPYIKKYLQHEYGDNIILGTDDDLGLLIGAGLEKKFYSNEKKELIHRAFDKYTTECTIYLPIHFLTEYRYGMNLSEKNTVYINKYLEKNFKRELLWYCYVLSLADIEYKTALLQFCNLRNIEIDVDITMDNLQQMNYRTRKKEEEKLNNSPQSLSVLVPKILQGTFFENMNQVKFKSVKLIS